MPRRKDQAARRGQVEAAAERALVLRGAEGVRVADVAAEAGLSPATVLYYVPTRGELVRIAFRRALERFVEHRRAVVAGLDDAAEQLVAMLREGFPTSQDDAEVVPLYTGVQAIRDDPELAALVREVSARQVALYRLVLDRGAADGSFRLAASSTLLAETLVALEDAYGLYAVASGFPVDEGYRATLAIAEVGVGRRLDHAERTRRPVAGRPAPSSDRRRRPSRS
jgi:AcrR family transcriptional regulator